MPNFKRRKKLIDPSLQLRLTFVFVALTAMALLLQFVLFTRNMSHIALRLPNDGLVLVDEMSALLISTLAWSFLVFLPITFVVGVLVTFRVAGPLYRFRVFLNDVRRGARPDACHIRKGDQLQDFCDLLNTVTEPLRRPVDEQAQASLDVDSVASLTPGPAAGTAHDQLASKSD
jgi:hypothetical protein